MDKVSTNIKPSSDSVRIDYDYAIHFDRIESYINLKKRNLEFQ
jgi:hypothetical protein